MEFDPLIKRDLPNNSNTNNWLLWCRLCSKIIHEKVDIDESKDNVMKKKAAIQRYFDIDITDNGYENFPKRLCGECSALITSMLQFTELVNKVQNMYNCISKSSTTFNTEIFNVREEFGIHQPYVNSFVNILDNVIKYMKEKSDIETKSIEFVKSESEILFPVNDGFDSLPFEAENKTQIRSFNCAVCEMSFMNEKCFRKHMKTKHPFETSEIDLNCDYCAKRFISKSNKEFHMRTIHNKSNLYICEHCGISARTMGTLKEHLLTHSDDAPFQCKVCHKNFKHQQRLKNHMEIHDSHKHICAQCGLQLNSRHTLNRHLLVHSDELSHKCDYCGRAFKRAKTLKNHLILHTGLKPYACDFCDRTFANGSNCRSHKKKAHPKELAELEASGGGNTYNTKLPKLAALKAVTKAAHNLTPVVCKKSGRFSSGKKTKSNTASR